MAKDKPKKGDRKKKAGKKTAQLAIRIEKAERDAFVALCEAQDTSAAREIRRFMRDYVAAHAKTPAPAAPDTPLEAEAPAPAPEAPPKPPRARRAKAKSETAEPAKAPAAAPKAPRARRSTAKTETAAKT